MHALEMEVEEMEALNPGIGDGRKSRKRAQPTFTERCIGACTGRGGFCMKGVFLVAVVLLVVILVFSSEEAGEAENHTVAQKERTPAPAEPTPVAEAAPAPTPTAAEEHKPDEKPVAVDAAADNVYLYSKYATVQPLPEEKPLTKEERDKLVEDYGKWSFWDGDEEMRKGIAQDANGNIYEKFPNRDVDESEWPDVAWQVDAVFVNHYLDAADKMLTFAMEAVFAEYGHGKPMPPEMLGERIKMFHWEKMDAGDVSKATAPPAGGNGDKGGWTTADSWDGFVRRLLHAMISSDTFTVVVAGDSKPAGYGNHFKQSYPMQFYKVAFPIFARLGVKLIVRNMAIAGESSIHQDMGFGSIYGSDVDLVIWDSKSDNKERMDLFMRQALLSGNRIPMIWGGDFDLLKELHESVNADVGGLGLGTYGVDVTATREQAEKLPYAVRYLKCTDDAAKLCQDEPLYCAKCWIDRHDKVVPEEKQLENPPGQNEGLPGWREHQLQGRVLAFTFMSALQDAVNIYLEGVMGGPPLDDDLWHVKDYYKNIKDKLKDLSKTAGKCHDIKGVPSRMCDVPMKARTQYTPRANPEETSLTSIIKAPEGGSAPANDKKALYEGPDVSNPCMVVPSGQVDVYAIVTGRRRHLEEAEMPPVWTPVTNRSLADDSIKPGKGWQVVGEKQGYCDGTYRSVCGRSTDEDCVLSGYHDSRGAVVGNEYSGWLVMTLKDLVEGIIVISLHTWHVEEENTVTKDWTSVNDESSRRLRVERRTERNYKMPDLPETFAFQYAIDGKITTLNKSDFTSKLYKMEELLDVMTLLDDADFASEAKDVELAIRLKGCARTCTFGLTHVYWA